MEIGEPDFDTPAEIKKAAVDALYDNHTHYTPSSGLPLLRETIAEYASRFRGISPPWTAANVVVGPGAKPVIWNTLSALLDEGDDFIYFDPAYPAYASCASYLQANVQAIPLLESRNWRMDLDELARRVSRKTKVVVINSPHNPTGGVLTKSDLEFIAELAERYDFLVLADEIYSRNFYLDTEYVSIASLPGMRDRTIVVDGFSKAYAMTGWRLGYAILPERLAKTVTLFNNNTFSCVATFVQMAGVAALTGSDEPVLRMNEIFRQRRDRLVNGLNAIPGLSCLLPEGAFYAFPNVSAITQNDRALAKYLLEEGGVACGGGSSFGPAGKGYLRFSYAASLDDIDWALASIKEKLPKFTE
jgi:aspartate/methionine/tyrosine aminotransferase